MSDAADFRLACFGRERLGSRLSIARHRHAHGYIAVVLTGDYQEAGLAGRFALEAGNVVVHRPFDAHLNHVSRHGAEVLNLPLLASARLPSVFRISDVDEIARLAERDLAQAALALQPAGKVRALDDWADSLAQTIANNPDCRFGSWAEEQGFAAETLSRGFRRAYGVAPARFRVELRTQQALHLIIEGAMPLSAIAAECGFSDQPHLTRSIVQLTGRSPARWRGSNSFKTARRPRL